MAAETRHKSALEEFERENDTRPPFVLTLTEAKLLGIAGVGFFLDGQSYSVSLIKLR